MPLFVGDSDLHVMQGSSDGVGSGEDLPGDMIGDGAGLEEP